MTETSDKTFKEAQGLPAVEHAKKLAKAKSVLEKKAKEQADKHERKVYTQVGKKVVQVTIYPKGAKSIYIGNLEKEKKYFNDQIPVWKKDGLWIGQDEFENKCSEIREQLAQAAQSKGK